MKKLSRKMPLHVVQRTHRQDLQSIIIIDRMEAWNHFWWCFLIVCGWRRFAVRWNFFFFNRFKIVKENKIRVESEVNGFNSHPNFQAEARKSETLLLFLAKGKINRNFTSPDETETVVKVRSERNSWSWWFFRVMIFPMHALTSKENIRPSRDRWSDFFTTPLSQNAKCFLERHDEAHDWARNKSFGDMPVNLKGSQFENRTVRAAPRKRKQKQKVWQKIKRPRIKQFFTAWCWVMLWLRRRLGCEHHEVTSKIFIGFYCSLMWHGELAFGRHAIPARESFRLSSTFFLLQRGSTRTVPINYLTISPRLRP